MIGVQVVTTTKIDDSAYRAFLSDCGATLNSDGQHVVCAGGSCVLFTLYHDLHEIYGEGEEEDELQSHFDAPVSAVLVLLYTVRSRNLVYVIAKKFIDRFGGLYDNGSEVIDLDIYLARIGIVL